MGPFLKKSLAVPLSNSTSWKPKGTPSPSLASLAIVVIFCSYSPPLGYYTSFCSYCLFVLFMEKGVWPSISLLLHTSRSLSPQRHGAPFPSGMLVPNNHKIISFIKSQPAVFFFSLPGGLLSLFGSPQGSFLLSLLSGWKAAEPARRIHPSSINIRVYKHYHGTSALFLVDRERRPQWAVRRMG